MLVRCGAQQQRDTKLPYFYPSAHRIDSGTDDLPEQRCCTVGRIKKSAFFGTPRSDVPKAFGAICAVPIHCPYDVITRAWTEPMLDTWCMKPTRFLHFELRGRAVVHMLPAVPSAALLTYRLSAAYRLSPERFHERLLRLLANIPAAARDCNLFNFNRSF